MRCFKSPGSGGSESSLRPDVGVAIVAPVATHRALGSHLAILGKIAEAIARFLARLFGVFGGRTSDVTTGVLLIVAGLVAWSSWKLYPVVMRWLTAGRTERVMRENATWEPLAEAADLFDQASLAFRDGRHAEAIRLALLALIARLEKRVSCATTRRGPTANTRGNFATCRSSPRPLANSRRIYDRVWYGRVRRGRADAEQAILFAAR